MHFAKEKHFEALQNAIQLCNAESLYVTGTGKESHKVFHYTLKKNSDHNPSYILEFASTYVTDQVYKRINEGMESKLMRFLKSSKDYHLLAIVRGHFFERKAHEILQGGGPFTIRKLAKGHDADKYEEEIELDPKNEVYFDDLSNEDHKRSDMYLQPNSETLKSVDSIAPPNAAFQITASTSHSINTNELHKVVKFHNPRGDMAFRLYIAVPPDKFGSYTKKQKYVNADKTDTVKIPNLVQS